MIVLVSLIVLLKELLVSTIFFMVQQCHVHIYTEIYLVGVGGHHCIVTRFSVTHACTIGDCMCIIHLCHFGIHNHMHVDVYVCTYIHVCTLY